MASTTLRISLARNRAEAVVFADGGLVVRPEDGAASAPLVQPEVTTVLDVRPQAGGLLLAGAVPAGARVAIGPLAGGPTFFDGRPYRGSIVLERADGSTLNVINVVDLEQYLYSVVGSEIGGAYPPSALAAQAIVARTYAVAHLGAREQLGYDLVAGEGDQAYQGMLAESQAVIDAVDSTRGVVLVFGGELVHAYYSACNGGYTSDGSALSDPQPYLVAAPDPYGTDSPEARWSVSVSAEAVRDALAPRFGDVGSIRAVLKGPADASGRLEWLTIVGSAGTRTIASTTFRRLIGSHTIRSTRISSIDLAGSNLEITGSGYGHGVGMSQCSARVMAQSGFGIQDILRFYFPGSTLVQLADQPVVSTTRE